jgi:hypothetical protein
MNPRSLILMAIFTLPCPVRSQDSIAQGLIGKVRSVFTEDVAYQENPAGISRGSNQQIYDTNGYLTEVYQYKEDGSLWAHQVFIRDGLRILESRTTGSTPFQNSTERNFFDTQGHIIETITYDENGKLLKRWAVENPVPPSDSTTRSEETSPDGHEIVREVAEYTDSKTGISHQIATVNGQLEYDWTIEWNQSGELLRDRMVYADGSYNKREHTPDGWMVEDRYAPATNSHSYLKWNAKGGPLTDSIQESGDSYLRLTFSYDKAGRPTGQINYDKNGLILEKSSIEYVDDAIGNWTEKKVNLWDLKSDPPKQTTVLVTVRTVVYY